MAATAKLVEATGAHVAALAVLIELTDLKGRSALKGYDLHSLIQLSD